MKKKYKPLVSIVCPAYNIEKYLPETIDCVLNQTWEKWELIICDDGSTDETGKIADKYEESDSRIKVIHQLNSGLPAAARNSAAEKVKGELIAFLDGDDKWEPEKLEAQVNYLKKHPEFGSVHTSYDLIGDQDRIDFLKNMWEWTNHDVANFKDLLLKKARLHISSLMIYSELFSKHGGFDEDPDLKGVEDYDFILRIAAEKPIAHIKKVLSHYRILKKSVSHNKDYNLYGKSLLLLQKYQKLGLLKDPEVIKQRKAEIIYSRGIDSLYHSGGSFRMDFWKAFKINPSNLKIAITFFFCWIPGPVLRPWLKTLLSIKNKLLVG